MAKPQVPCQMFWHLTFCRQFKEEADISTYTANGELPVDTVTYPKIM